MCEFCKPGENLVCMTGEYKIYLKTSEEGVRVLNIDCTPCPPNAKCGLHNVPSRVAVLINFCPYCGRDLRVKE